MANGARMEGIDANLFFTFFGLDAINRAKHDHVKVATVGEPGLHLATWLGGFPGMSSLVTPPAGRQDGGTRHPAHPRVRGDDLRLRRAASTPARHRSTCSGSTGTTSSTRSTTSSPSASSTSSPPAARSSSPEQAGTRSSHPARRLRDPECSASGRPRRSERSWVGNRCSSLPVVDSVRYLLMMSFLLLVADGCGQSTGRQHSGSLVVTVTAGPTCPVERPGRSSL